MMPNSLKPRWVRLLIAAILIAWAIFAWINGTYAVDGAMFVSVGILFVSMLPGLILLGSLLFDFIGHDPEEVDYSPEAVATRMKAREKARR